MNTNIDFNFDSYIEDEIIREGMTAFYDGKLSSQNPYEKDSSEYIKWEMGWWSEYDLSQFYN